jgi:hypothetical protein
MRCMNLTYEVIGDQDVNPIPHNCVGVSSYRSKIDLIFILNLSSMMTPRSLVVFKLLIFTLFNLWLLISTLLARKAFQISKVVEK